VTLRKVRFYIPWFIENVISKQDLGVQVLRRFPAAGQQHDHHERERLNPNKNSICGLELTEEIKVVLEHACPGASGPNGWLSDDQREQQPHK
jgi:hypothetical protein